MSLEQLDEIVIEKEDKSVEEIKSTDCQAFQIMADNFDVEI